MCWCCLCGRQVWEESSWQRYVRELFTPCGTDKNKIKTHFPWRCKIALKFRWHTLKHLIHLVMAVWISYFRKWSTADQISLQSFHQPKHSSDFYYEAFILRSIPVRPHRSSRKNDSSPSCNHCAVHIFNLLLSIL